MKAAGFIGCAVLALMTFRAFGADDFLDAVDDALTVSGWHDTVRARLSGTVDLEYYQSALPAPGLIFSSGRDLFNPRLSLFLDAQLGPRVYLFAQGRADRTFDPSDDGAQLRLEEYAVRFTPWTDGRLNFQLGKFATVVGNWVERHDSWDNPFITAPLPYENLTGIWDIQAAGSAAMLLVWSHVTPSPLSAGGDDDKYRRLPIIWGPSYATGAAVSGIIGKLDFAAELKNASLSSRPETWDVTQTQWQHPTWSGRIGYRPDERWNFGFSASTGTYLRPATGPTLAPGYTLGDYRETVLGQDVGFAWHHVQFWAECYEARFAVPLVGQMDTFAYYLEARYKFTPQFFGALRWNQQRFSTVPDAAGAMVPWGRNIWRIDIGPEYRFTPHTQLKLQYNLQHEDNSPRDYTHLIAAQFVVRF
jgi:hypothetical protein